jgi:hypothetical protein
MAKNDGGPAFPVENRNGLSWPRGKPPVGMSLRDWFAGQALMGLAAYPGREGEVNGSDHFAKWSYMLADAMIEIREGE